MSKVLHIKVIPRSKKTEFGETMSDGTLKIRLRAVPEKGKANEMLLDFLAKEYGGNWQIVSGTTSSRKIVKKYKNPPESNQGE